ncbi:MAG: gamma-glutamyltransferase, partial [Candidatus Wallbacteria bacterium]|nr:gamma-glutamyltransferase [Candidatus Wallbacteria bacterium]
AAIAAALMVGAVSPSGSGIGGGGFLVYWSAKDRRAYALDFRETAPAALEARMFLRDGKADTHLSQRGGLAVGVPGEVAGFREASRRFGRVPWRRLVLPAAAAARFGFRVTPHTAEDLREVEKEMGTAPGLVRIYSRDGRPLEAAEFLRNPDLAATLDTIAGDGGESFYRGEVGRRIVRTVRAAGGVMTAADLARYRPTWREPVHGTHHGLDVYSMPPPSSGGAIVLEVLNTLDLLPVDWKHPDAPSTLHFIGEAEKHAFSDRAVWFGDPGFVRVPLATLTSREHARRLAALIRAGRTAPAGAYVHQLPADSGTTHVSAMDAEGNACGLTSTINTEFGSLLVADGAGIILNDQMDDFSHPAMVVGGSGGPHIITGTLRVLTCVVDGGLDVGEALTHPRVHHQWSPDALRLERGIPASTVERLRAMGHNASYESPDSAIQAVVAVPGGFRAASDPRKGGRAAAW